MVVYSRTKERAIQYAYRHGVKKIYDDLDELAVSKEVDAVYVASPNSFHADHSIKMLQSKKHVLCEKTIASNRMELDEILNLASQIQDEKGCMIIKEIPDTREITIIYNDGQEEHIGNSCFKLIIRRKISNLFVSKCTTY